MKSAYVTRPWFPVALAVLLLCLVALSSYVFDIPRAHSQSSSVPVTGYAWSENIGWISLNCSNDSSCATANYGLSLQNSTNLITGYAWSDSIGWIKFGGLSGFPSPAVAPGTTASDATLVSGGTYDNVVGWARACAGTLNGDCSSMADAAGGWNGWIALSGTNYGVTTVSNQNYTGNWAWDSDVAGWIAFNAVFPSCAATSPACSLDASGQQMSSYTTKYCQLISVDPCAYGCSSADGTCLPGTGDPGWLSASQNSIVSTKRISTGSTVTLYYYVPNARSCTLSGTNGDSWILSISGGKIAQGSKTTSALQGRAVYTLTCQKNAPNAPWTSSKNTVTITTAPQFQEI